MRVAILRAVKAPAPTSPRLVEVLGEIERCARKQSQHMFAGRLRLSRTYLSRRMSRETGRPPSEWCHASVMREAFRAVLETPEAISQIAYALGYEHHSQFDHNFVAMFGAAPRDIRRLCGPTTSDA